MLEDDSSSLCWRSCALAWALGPGRRGSPVLGLLPPAHAGLHPGPPGRTVWVFLKETWNPEKR